MKRTTIVITVCILFQAVITSAQNDSTINKVKKEKLLFHSINNIGLLEGEAGSGLQLQTINGFQYKTWFIGAGVGLDYYSVRSIPLFLDVRKDILSKKIPLFIYADAGIHFPWMRKYNATLLPVPDYSNNGLYYDAGLGYRLPLKKYALAFSAGYSGKQYKSENLRYRPCTSGTCPPYKEQFDYKLRRLSIKAGWIF